MNKPITLCDRCGVAMSCLLDYDGIPCRKNRTVEPTNADRIRALTDEELADAFMAAEKYGRIHNGQRTKEWWLEWLRQEATT